LVARSVRDAEVAGSNPAVPTGKRKMARKSRLDPGGFAYAGYPNPAPHREEHRDAPLSPRGRVIYRVILIAEVCLIVALVVAAFLSG
jgi:hypothetical protein